MNSEELDSQLSAMFDGELPAPECELLARRLARDEVLKARWGRYAAIGAAIRMESGVRLNGRLAERVSVALAAEPALLVGSSPTHAGRLVGRSLGRWWQPIAGAGVAASVAVAAILWLRTGSPDAPIVAQSGAVPAVFTLPVAASSDASDSYVVPPSVEGTSAAPPTELADFVVAHSEFSTPLLRRNALAALVASEWARSEPNNNNGGSNRDVRDTHADLAH
jgi:sigma-E factor negative regulatory protein RseA